MREIGIASVDMQKRYLDYRAHDTYGLVAKGAELLCKQVLEKFGIKNVYLRGKIRDIEDHIACQIEIKIDDQTEFDFMKEEQNV